jgi:arginyl-tRNA--protein-N-Asp/Glu arginylyltransferase
MTNYNLNPITDPATNYSQGLLPQRNLAHTWYQDTSCRSNLSSYKLSSENKRIIKSTAGFSFEKIPLTTFKLSPYLLNTLHSWTEKLGWHFPKSSIKNVFSHHIFNYLYLWRKTNTQDIIAYSICYFAQTISHIAYVFYSPELNKTNLPIRLSLQCIADSHKLGLKYCYLGRFSYYKRNFPGFEIYQDRNWLIFNH